MAITEDGEGQIHCGALQPAVRLFLDNPAWLHREPNQSPTPFMNSLLLRNEELPRGRPRSSKSPWMPVVISLLRRPWLSRKAYGARS